MNARIPLLGLLAIQVLIGYEWFMSGLTKVVRGGFPSGLAKIVRGGFPSGLAAELTDKSQGAPGWYRSFLDSSVIPNGAAFGYLIEIGELLIGIVLLVAGLIWLFGGERRSRRVFASILGATLLASLGAILMNLNFHLANGSAHPWLIPKDGFDEGVDLDSLLPAIQLALVFVSGGLLLGLRRDALGQRTRTHLHPRLLSMFTRRA